jgi:hypothetical protein
MPFMCPDELAGHPLKDDYIGTCQNLFETYQRSIPKVKAWLAEKMPQGADESNAAFERRLAPAAVDICRFLLPAAALANVGVTINARALEYAICKLLSSPLEEVHAIGEGLRTVGQLETPTLIKYAACNPYLQAVEAKMARHAQAIAGGDDGVGFRILGWDADGEDRILAAALFRFGETVDYQGCYQYVASLSPEQKADLAGDLMADRGKYDQPLREFEYAQMTFEAVMDQGAYFEFKRHRMMTQTVQPLSADLGFALPMGISAAGCEADYLVAMRQAADLYHRIQELMPRLPAISSQMALTGGCCSR